MPSLVKPNHTVYDVNHPSARNLALNASYIENGGTPFDYVARKQAILSNSDIFWTQSVMGPGRRLPNTSSGSTEQYNLIRPVPVWNSSIELWIDFNDLSNVNYSDFNTIISCDNLYGYGPFLAIIQDYSTLNYYIEFSTNAQTDFGVGTTPIIQGQLYHIVLTVDYNNSFKLFINGSLSYDFLCPDNLRGAAYSNVMFYPDIHGGPTVTVSSLRIWSRVLPPGEIATLYRDPWQMYNPPKNTVGMAVVSVPTYSGSASLSKQAQFGSSGHAGVAYTGSATLIKRVIFSGSSQIAPNFSGAAVLSKHPQINASGHVPPVYSGVAVLSRQAVIAGIGKVGTPITSSTFFAIHGIDNIHATTPMFIEGGTTVGGVVPLYAFNSVPVPGVPMNLFVQQDTAVFKFHTQASWDDVGYPISPSLFVRGSEGVEFSNLYSFNPLPLMMKGVQPTDTFESMNLVVINKKVGSSVTLQVTGQPPDQLFINIKTNTTLFTSGKIRFSSTYPHVPLYMRQDQHGLNSQTTLYIHGPTPINTHIFDQTKLRYTDPTLFVSGGIFKPFNRSTTLFLAVGAGATRSFNLFMQAKYSPNMIASLPMEVRGTAHQGQYMQIPLKIIGKGMGEELNLTIAGKDSGGTSKILRLMVQGGNPTAIGWTPLYVENDTSEIGRETVLYIRGAGVGQGYFPYGEGINLYVERGPTGGIPLIVENNWLELSLPFHIYGAPSFEDLTTLFITGLGGEVSSDVPFVIEGNVPQSVNLAADLVMPKVIGFTPSSATLYVNGFKF